MAQRLSNGAVAAHELEANEIDRVVSIRIDQVRLGERLRPVDMVWAAALAQVIARDGQQTPIEVCREPEADHWTLVSGGHRLEGMRAAGIEWISAIEVSANDRERRRREISENLMRRDLDPIERATFIAELVASHRLALGAADKSAQEVAAAARWKKEAEDASVTMTLAYNWSQDVANELGFSVSTVERDVRIYRSLPPSLIEALRAKRHPILKSQAELLKLAKMTPEQREAAVEALVSRGAPKLAGVMHLLPGIVRPETDAEAKRLSTFIGTFQRMGLVEKKGALAELRPLLPAGITLRGTAGQTAPDEKYRDEVAAALELAMATMQRLIDGDGVEDDELHHARSQAQLALMAVNAGGLPTGGAA